MKIMFGAAIQGARDRHAHRAVNRRIILQIKDAGLGLVTEHTMESTPDDVETSLDKSIGPLPPAELGLRRKEYIRSKIIDGIESKDVKAAIFEATIPSLGTGIELAHSYLRPRLGKSEIPILVLYHEGYWESGLSMMVRGLPFYELPNVEVHYYKDMEEMDRIVVDFIDRLYDGKLKPELARMSDDIKGKIDIAARKLFNPVGLFVPMVSKSRAKQILEWHKENYFMRQRRVGGTNIQMDYFGLDLRIHPDVFEPKEASQMLAQAVLEEVEQTDRVLEVNTASGANALLAATVSRSVEATDFNPIAVNCTRENIERNGLSGRVSAYEGHVFDQSEATYDLIIIDPPFKWFEPRDMYERGITDRNYEGMRKFISQAHRYLNPGGRILMLFSSSGDIDYVNYLIEYCGFKKSIVSESSLIVNGKLNKYYVYKLTL